MTKRKGPLTDIKAPQKRALRLRKPTAGEEDGQLAEQEDELAATETKEQDSGKINYTSQNAFVSEITLQECPVAPASTENTGLSTAEVKELVTITQCDGVVSSGVEPEDTVTPSVSHKPLLLEGLNVHLVCAKENQPNHPTSSAEHIWSQTNQTTSPCLLELSVGGDATGEDPGPTVGGEPTGEDPSPTVGGEPTGEDPSSTVGGEATGEDPSPTVGGEPTGEDPSSTVGGEAIGEDPSPTVGGEPTGEDSSATVVGKATGQDPSPTVGGEATGEDPSPTVGGAEVGSEVSESESQQQGEEASCLPKAEGLGLGCGASSQGASDGGATSEADAPGRKRVRRRMGMGGLGLRERKNLLEGQKYRGKRSGGGGGEKERESDGGEKEREADGERGLKVDDGHIQGIVQLGIAQSDTPLERSSEEEERSGLFDDRNTEQPEPAAITTCDCSRTILHSEKVTREENNTQSSQEFERRQQHTGASDIARAEEEIEQMELEVQQRSLLEDNSGQVKDSSSTPGIIKLTNNSADVGKASLGNQIQKPDVTVTTVAKHNIPNSPHKVEDAHNAISDDLKLTKPKGTPECNSTMKGSSNIIPSESAAPSSGQEDSMREGSPVPVKGHDPEQSTHITPGPCHDPDPFDPSSINAVSDSQLNNIIIEMEDQHGPESSRSHEDATELVCGLIRELSSLNRTVMAAHRELESLRRGNRAARTPQRRPYAPRRPETQSPSMPLPGQ